MTVIRRRTLLWRWPLVTFIVFALFWGIWYFVAGSVPATESVKLTITESWTLPFAVSRWWDLLIFAGLALILLPRFRWRISASSGDRNMTLGSD